MTTRDEILELFADAEFDLVRITTAEPLNDAFVAASSAFEQGNLTGLHWMDADWIARASDPAVFLEGARSVILAGISAHAADPVVDELEVTRGRIARYARGRDYHRIFEKKLRRIANVIKSDFSAMARSTVDYGPLLERSFAMRAGLGWLGKSTMLLAPGFGPWLLLGAVVTSLNLDPDEELKKSCGSGTRCITACSTGAIDVDGGVLDSRLCSSYHTIENRGVIPYDLRSKFGDWIFGCDICLDSCPVGSKTNFAYPDTIPVSIESAMPALIPLLSLDEKSFRRQFRGSAVSRATRDGLVRNTCVALGNVGVPGDLESLEIALKDNSALVRGHAVWAIARIISRFDLPEMYKEVLSVQLSIEADPFVRDELNQAFKVLTSGEKRGLNK